ncbi:MAG: peptide chain release factor 2 [Alphaproteobacteria bacterium]|nr:peptide chain release factor 2 [Alphaproteobacteria bacterium]
MRADFYNLNSEIEQSLGLLRRYLDYDQALLRLAELTALCADEKLWDNPENAQKLLSERNNLESKLQQYDNFVATLKYYVEMIEFAESTEDETMLDELLENMTALQQQVKYAELESLLSGEADANDAYLEVHAGSGGTEAMDWAQMLLRMYERWAENHHYKVEIIEETEGDVAGMKSATIKICGKNAYGWLKSESGVHRLVRISPFDSNARRHTSFASVGVYPDIDDTVQIEINPADCRIDTYRASGAGGQHINKTDSAVRITHIPTGIVVSSQTQRSQFQNRDNCWKMLRARLYEMEMQKKADAAQAVRDNQGDNGWGYQIRSYVLQPYRLVKDLRTEAETSDCKAVLDGDIDLFLSAALAQKIKDDSINQKDGQG